MLDPNPETDIASLLPLPHLTVVARNEEIRMRVQPDEHPGNRRPRQGLGIQRTHVSRFDRADHVPVPLQQGSQRVRGREPTRRLDPQDRCRDGRPHQQRHQQGDDPRPEPHGVILAASRYSSSRFLPRIRLPTQAMPMDSV